MEKLNVIIETSARHVHLSAADLKTLFGEGVELTLKRELSQPGEFLSNERVAVIGPKGEFPSVAILGPTRPNSQIEVTKTDARVLGVEAPVRASGDVMGSPGVKLRGPAGEVELEYGVIVAKRHIHITPEDAEKYGFTDKQTVNVKVGGERGLVFGEVVIRVSEKFRTYMHVDIDEANAAGLVGEPTGEVF